MLAINLNVTANLSTGSIAFVILVSVFIVLSQIKFESSSKLIDILYSKNNLSGAWGSVVVKALRY